MRQKTENSEQENMTPVQEKQRLKNNMLGLPSPLLLLELVMVISFLFILMKCIICTEKLR